MSLTLLTYTPLGSALAQGLPAQPEGARWFIPGLPSSAAHGIVGDGDAPEAYAASRLGEVAMQHYAFTRMPACRHVGFEHFARPFFIVPFSAHRLRDAFPDLLAAREDGLRDWNTAAQPGGDGAAGYWRMRGAQGAAERARLQRWLGRIDVVIPGKTPGPIQQRLHAQHGGRWAEFAKPLPAHGVFGRLSEAALNNPAVPCQTNAYIIRFPLFAEYAAAFFSVLRACGAPPEPGAVAYLAARTFGLFLLLCRAANPLLRVAELPLLTDAPKEAPAAPPARFSAAAYLRANPDIARAGADPVMHYLAYGWQEQRDWSLAACD